MKPRKSQAFIRKILKLISPPESEIEDLVQDGLLALELLSDGYAISFYWKHLYYRLIKRIQHARRCKYVPVSFQQSCADPATLVERKDFKEAVQRHLLSKGEQGLKDWVVVSAILNGLDYTQVCEMCPWLSNPDSVNHTVVRIVEYLRSTFEGDALAPLSVGRDAKIKAHKPRDVSGYNAAYYKSRQAERIAAIGEARKLRREAETYPDIRTGIHVALLSAGYVRYSLAESGASAYYVCVEDGFRVRVSDHESRRPEKLFCLRVDTVSTADEGITAIEAARRLVC